MRDWRLPENRREAFQRFYAFHLTYKAHPGCVYSLLPGIADALHLTDEQRAWLVWLNGNTQNAVTSLVLLEAAPFPHQWPAAVDCWNENFKALEWDADRRHQKSRFGEATEKWWSGFGPAAVDGWLSSGEEDWTGTWRYALAQPYMGRLSAWSMTEYARILLGPGVPDIGSLMLKDKSGSRSHRNGLALIAGYDSTYWDADTADMLGIVEELESLGESLLEEQRTNYSGHADTSYLTLESALCTYKSWHKPNRRYPGVYLDMMYERLKKGEARLGPQFDLIWNIRRATVPGRLLLEDNPIDPGLSSPKQNHYLLTGEIPVLGLFDPVVGLSEYDRASARGAYGIRKDKQW